MYASQYLLTAEERTEVVRAGRSTARAGAFLDETAFDRAVHFVAAAVEAQAVDRGIPREIAAIIFELTSRQAWQERRRHAPAAVA